ncbi:MDIS1-interacting receptor like kinase 2-like protein, partial [Tanacetum coccineum]
VRTRATYVKVDVLNNENSKCNTSTNNISVKDLTRGLEWSIFQHTNSFRCAKLKRASFCSFRVEHKVKFGQKRSHERDSSKIGDSSRLQVFNLGSNLLKDGFLIWVTSLDELQVLDLSDNEFISGLPRQFGGLKMLEVLKISIVSSRAMFPISKSFDKHRLKQLKTTKGYVVIDDFNSKHITRGCGTVYRAELPTGELVAIRKFTALDYDELIDVKNFENEDTDKYITQISCSKTINKTPTRFGLCSNIRKQYLELT